MLKCVAQATHIIQFNVLQNNISVFFQGKQGATVLCQDAGDYKIYFSKFLSIVHGYDKCMADRGAQVIWVKRFMCAI